MHPGIFREDRPDVVRPGLDPFNPNFGFNPNGPSTYSDEFKEKYHRAQADRMNRLIDDALERLRLMDEGKYRYPDDDVFPVSRVGAGFGGGGGETGLFHFDLSILCCTLKPQKLLKNDGTIVTQIVRSVRVAEPENEEESKTFEDGTLLVTIRSFLGAKRDSGNALDRL